MSRYNLLVLMTLAVVWAMSAEISNARNCPPNERYSICGRICEPSCADTDPINDNWFCQSNLCWRPITGGCTCDSNFVRNNTYNSPCIPPEKCPNN
ncbi:cysteine-rich venom protein 6-like [Lasioglossum baleicum]|uniref:cysteine-rich venom protein 6-like n=1 Tax=Lasioglossum baleicum TaxID=434251 RepID=UPI003FCCC0D4